MIGLGLGSSYSAPLQDSGPVSFDNKAFSFDGATQRIVANNASDPFDVFNGVGATFSFWYRHDGDSDYFIMNDSETSTGNGWFLGFSNDRVYFYGKQGSSIAGLWADASNTISNDTYHNITVVVDDSSTSNFAANSKIYIDAVEVTGYTLKIAQTVNFDQSSGSFIIGGPNQSGYVAIDELNDVAIFTTRLNASNVTAIYNNGVPIDLLVDSGDYNSSSDLDFYITADRNTYGSGPFYSFTEETGTYDLWALGNVDIVTSTL